MLSTNAENQALDAAALATLPRLPGSLDARTLELALIARFTEEALLALFSEGLLHGTVHTCIGQELSGAIIGNALRPDDTVFSNHRCHGHFLARQGDVDGLVAELMGRETGVCGGLGGSQHLYQAGFHSNGIQGGIVPVAAGLALGHQLRGGSAVSVVHIGDGTLGEGAVYETFNIASKWHLPLLVVLEDNGYAQSTAQHETLAGDIGARAAAFGIPVAHGDTWHFDALQATVNNLLDGMRQDGGPRFLHVRTARLKAHSKGDDTRPRSVVQPLEEADPLNRYLDQATPVQQATIDALRARVRQAVDRARSAPAATTPTAAPTPASTRRWAPATPVARQRLVAALNDTLSQWMAHPQAFLMGEDIESPYGGAFKATKALSDRFPGRVRNTPISEAAIAGMGAGLALGGHLPLVEIMFGDFIGLAFDALVNHAAKFHGMYNGQVRCPLVVRTPMGGGRGYGPTHSQTLDRHFFGVPGLRVLAMNSLTQPAQLYGALDAAAPGPSLVIENKLLYGQWVGQPAPHGWELLHSDAPFPDAWLRPQSEQVDLTLLGYGGSSELLREAAERLFEDHDLVAQVLCPMQVYPFDVQTLAGALAGVPRLLVVEEGQGFAGFGAEVIGQLAEAGQLGGPQGLRVRRHHPPAQIIPASGALEKAMLPGVDSIVRDALALCAA
jgi:2-oxoisovalerate dehydrogenase E1 component